ncbi:hypothetical protein [Bradyrhizobium tropiciagri]|uniref:hypothetical protein n=1 Tax=Bradyrhizobium tropiciagri TaxID=312253 RepID=UPI00100995EA|nr:hypothetical protein [Bradyrhizobium tropiciagri]
MSILPSFQEIGRPMSASLVELSLSPFVKCGREISNVGYLDVSTGRVVASLEVPLGLIERAVLANVSVEIALAGDGRIASSVAGEASAYSSAVKTVSIDHLIQEFLAGDNLRLEETTQAELRTLLNRLQDSARAVQRAIASFERSANEA